MTYQQLLAEMLLKVRSYLSFFQGGAMLAKQSESEIPVEIMIWLDKWLPYIELWQKEEQEFRQTYFSETSDSVNFRAAIHKLGSKLNDIVLAHAELEALQIIQRNDIELTVKAIQGLKKLHQEIQNEDYDKYLKV